MTAKFQRAALISRASAEMWDYESPEKEDSRIHVINNSSGNCTCISFFVPQTVDWSMN